MPADHSALPDAEDLFEQAPCGLVVTAEDGTILRGNRTFCSWIGTAPAELAGKRLQELLTMGGRIFHQTHWAPLMKMQGSVAEVKLDMLHRDGHAVTMLLNGVRREHPGGVFYELALFSTVERDRYERELLSARKRAEELLQEKIAAQTALQQAKAELAAAYEKSQRRALFAEQMVGIASHDLKNPLTAIKMAAQFLARGERSERESQLVSHISTSSERAQRMIADLLDFTRVRVGHGIVANRRPLDLHMIARQSVSELRIAFPQATLLHVCKGEGVVELDPDRTQQMIGNLVANSVAYGDPQRPVTIATELTANLAVISVHNHGPAIPESSIPGLFDSMTRASDRDNSVRSVGLGLFIVREITLAHGGEVAVSSETDTGTTFSIRMPLLKTLV